MIKTMKLIPVTMDSYPFQTAAKKCNFDQIGYIEDEYFMSGTADIYSEADADHKVEAVYKNAPYTTRLLVRRPRNVIKFSGNVVIEILNASAMMDIDRMWVNSWKYFTRNGDIYIGITSKGHVVDALKRFDEKRYAAINWDNPMPERKIPEESSPFGFLEQYESGLYWDMQTDLAKLLQSISELNPIRHYGKCYLYLAGWSQSGSYMSRTIHSFSYRQENMVDGPLFDGYLEAGAASALAPTNAYEMTQEGFFGNGTIPKGGVIMSREPYICINTESENRGANWIGDSDLPDYKFRTYQIAGTSHDSYYNIVEYYEGHLFEDAKKASCELKFGGCEGEPLNTPYEFVFNAAFRNLYSWVRDGVPAPHAPKIDVVPAKPQDFDALTVMLSSGKMKYENHKDAFGNTTGGIRMAALDYPVGVYKSYSVRENNSYDAMFGTLYPFSLDKLKGLYGTLSHYKDLVNQSAEETIALGFLLKEDKEEYVDRTVRLAEKLGLND